MLVSEQLFSSSASTGPMFDFNVTTLKDCDGMQIQMRVLISPPQKDIRRSPLIYARVVRA